MTSAAPSEIAVRRDEAVRMGFFTDTTVCIGCKSCEVACKQWNDLPADGFQFRKGGSYDHTGSLGAATWRHVRFVERLAPSPAARAEAEAALAAGAGGHTPSLPASGSELPSVEELGGAGGGVRPEEVPDLVEWADERSAAPGANGGAAAGGEIAVSVVGAGDVDVGEAVAAMDRWLFMSDVCKHCTNAGCLDACPTGALIRTEFQTVIVQPDICNGCGYCVPSCPFGVPNRDPYDGRAAKCTLCYDRLQDGLEPACAKACPTDSIQFGPYDELVEVAKGRVIALHERGIETAYLYGAGDEPGEQLAGGLGAFFLLTEAPERFGLPAHADSPIQESAPLATAAGLAAAALAALGAIASFAISKRRAPR
jgi:formate dehydrogenase iron-sulfur subunit